MIDELDPLSDLDQLQSRYDVLRRLGQDGEFIVYGVRSAITDRHYAVKVMANPGTRGAVPGALNLWHAHTVERLDHPALVPLHAVHHLQGGAVALAMERRRGPTVADRIRESGPLDVAEVERILREVAEALAYLHRRGVVHRGVRPESILLDRDSGRARLAHFAIETVSDDPASARRTAYLAPEQTDGRAQPRDAKVTDRTDLYSLGAVGYAMLKGGDPREAPHAEPAGSGRPPPFSPLADIRPDAPHHLHRALEGCLHRSVRRRWRSIDEFIAQLDPDAGSAALPRSATWAAARQSIENRLTAIRSVLAHRRREGSRVQVASGVSGLFALLIGAGFLLGRDGSVEDGGSRMGGSAAAREASGTGTGRPGAASDASWAVSTRLGSNAIGAQAHTLLPDSAFLPGGAIASAQRTAVAPSRPAQARATPAPGGLVLLGEPVDRRSNGGLLGDQLGGR